jgi:hypothetical protein
MSARLKATILIGSLILMVWIGSKLGGAVDKLGAEINGRRAQVMAGR